LGNTIFQIDHKEGVSNVSDGQIPKVGVTTHSNLTHPGHLSEALLPAADPALSGAQSRTLSTERHFDTMFLPGAYSTCDQYNYHTNISFLTALRGEMDRRGNVK
jgi:hypothetical protein